VDQLGLFTRLQYETEREAARYAPMRHDARRTRPAGRDRGRFAMLRPCLPSIRRPMTRSTW
jgi:hypothetical protein